MHRYEYYNMTDPTLWGYLSNGDKIALEVLYRRYFSSLFNYGKSFCSNEELVKDCIQDLFVKIYNSKSSSPRFVKAYLFRILRNCIYDKKYSAMIELPIGEIDFDLLVEDVELENLFGRGDEDLLMSKRLRKAFSLLPSNPKNALYLRFIKDFSWAEIAEALNITSHSAMNLIARALSKLSSLLEK